MVADNKDAILSEYREKRPIYEGFTLTCEDLVRRLLRFTNFRVHSVTSRTKGIEELAEKISHPDKQYDKLQDVTDLSGVRVITYFSDDVDKIGTLIEREFKVFPDKSVDKRKVWSPDKFGYLSVHYVCSLSDKRVALSEYTTFRGYICEIQVRTILQHAWAEIEHDLGYKVPQGIPEVVRRRFSRLAGLLEMGDDEFKNIRDELETYAVNIKREIPITPSKVLIDRLSLIAFVKQDTEYQKLDKALVDYAGAELEDITNTYADSRVQELQYVGLKTIQELKSALEQNADSVMRVFRGRIKPGSKGSLSHGIALFYLVQALIAQRGDLQSTVKALEELHIGDPKNSKDLAERLFRVVRKKP